MRILEQNVAEQVKSLKERRPNEQEKQKEGKEEAEASCYRLRPYEKPRKAVALFFLLPKVVFALASRDPPEVLGVRRSLCHGHTLKWSTHEADLQNIDEGYS